MRGIAAIPLLLILFSGCLSQTPSFDADRAFSHLEAQVGFGPRVPGLDAHRMAQEYFTSEFEKYCDEVRLQLFVVEYEGVPYEMANVVCEINPEGSPSLLLAAHYDSRPYADRDSPEKWDTPIPGANDGASGVAILLEVARVLSQKKPDTSVTIVLFDGEDFGKSLDYYFLGSRYYSSNMDSVPDRAILLDMVGDRDLKIYIEGNSLECCADLVSEVWDIAQGNGVDAFVRQEKYSILDDHIPFIERGVNMIDIIDFDYPYWHTLQDTPDKCSSESLAAVGKVILIFVYSQR